jgi:phospholipid N-methyltransferase
MLDTSHPHSHNIFEAGRLEGAILTSVESIMIAPPAERQRLVMQCEQTLDSMRALSRHFGDSQFISESIDDLEKALHRLVETDQPRLDIIIPALTKLRSSKGFGTEFI